MNRNIEKCPVIVILSFQTNTNAGKVWHVRQLSHTERYQAVGVESCFHSKRIRVENCCISSTVWWYNFFFFLVVIYFSNILCQNSSFIFKTFSDLTFSTCISFLVPFTFYLILGIYSKAYMGFQKIWPEVPCTGLGLSGALMLGVGSYGDLKWWIFEGQCSQNSFFNPNFWNSLHFRSKACISKGQDRLTQYTVSSPFPVSVQEILILILSHKALFA